MNLKLLLIIVASLLFSTSLSVKADDVVGGKKQISVLSKANVSGKFVLGNSYTIKGKTYFPKVNKNYSEVGIASWYGGKFRGRRTANGSLFTSQEFTAAHRTLPLPSVVRVTNVHNGKSAEVIINDRGPFNNRIIDLSQKAAEHLGFMQQGHAKVKVEYLHGKTLALLAMYPRQENQKALKAFRVAAMEGKPASVEID